MMRWVIAIAFLLSPQLVQPAAAQARASSEPLASSGLPAMCGESSQTVLLSAPALGSAWQTSMASALDEGSPAPAPGNDAQTAWCISPDDPRCAPRDAGTPLHPQRSLPPLCDVASVRASQPEFSEAPTVALLARLGAPRPGVSLRVERPPRS